MQLTPGIMWRVHKDVAETGQQGRDVAWAGGSCLVLAGGFQQEWEMVYTDDFFLREYRKLDFV